MCVAWTGLTGTIVGALATLFAQWAKHQWETGEQRNRDKSRKALLAKMLNSPGSTGWRRMETLSHVIGANRDETARLLVDMGARGSENGNDVWAWIKDKPLPSDD